MTLKYTLATAALLLAVLIALRWPAPTDSARAATALAEQVLEAVARQDYHAFVAQADRGVRKMSAEQFRALAERHAARLRGGHELRPLDDRWRGDVHLHRWRVTFKGGGPVAVLTVGIKNGEVAMFALY